MNAQQSSRIFMLPPKDHVPGVCSVCDQNTVLKFRDASTGFRVGMCCRSALVVAEGIISSVIGSGFRHPNPDEFNG